MTLRRRLVLPLLGLGALAALPDAQEPLERGRTLFVKNCATCHGETGDGKGITPLDRPARSFMDGGFSFGNTPEALFRTISVGIPGTPMPGFDSSLSEEERKVLASYVVTLGPPVEEVKEEDMILSVHDRPLIVRGLLPSLGEGLPTHPRGLLIGDPSGITFEYRVDDLRLLALRQGGFVKRTDWTGRGGTPLEPLGKVVHLVEGGKPESMFWYGSTPVLVRLSGTNTRGNVSLEYHLVSAGRELAHAEELPSVVTASFGVGYRRTIWLRGVTATEVKTRSPLLSGASVLASGAGWLVLKPQEGAVQLQVLWGATSAGARAPSQLAANAQLEVAWRGAPGEKGFVELVTLVLFSWSDEVHAQVRRWIEDS